MYIHSVVVKDELNEFSRVDIKETRQGSGEGGWLKMFGQEFPILTNSNSSFERLNVLYCHFVSISLSFRLQYI